MRFAKDTLCTSCEKEKKTISSFKTKQCSSISSPFHLLHMDFFGHVTIKSCAGIRYLLFIVDEYSRFTWAAFFHNKNNVFEEIISLIK